MTPEKKKELKNREQVQIYAEKDNLKHLRDDFRDYVESASRPFNFYKGVSSDVRVTLFSRDDLSFLEGLKFLPPLRPSHLKAYAEHYREQNNPAMLLALSHYAEQNGYKLDGLGVITDPDQELAKFDSAIKSAEKIIEGVPEGATGFEETTLAILRDQLNQAWDDALVKDGNGNYKQQITIEKIPVTVEEEIAQSLDRQIAEQTATDSEEKANIDAMTAFGLHDEADQYMQGLAAAQVERVKDAMQEQAPQKEKSPLDEAIEAGTEAEKEMSTGAVWGSRS